MQSVVFKFKIVDSKIVDFAFDNLCKLGTQHVFKFQMMISDSNIPTYIIQVGFLVSDPECRIIMEMREMEH